MDLKCRIEKPTWVPLCTAMWQGLQRDTCFRLIRARSLSNEPSLTFMVLMCLIWCISIFFSEPQLAHGWSRALIVDIFHPLAASGSLNSFVPRKVKGCLVSGGHEKSSSTNSPSLRLIFKTMLGPYLRRNSLRHMFSFLHIVFLRLSLRNQ